MTPVEPLRRFYRAEDYHQKYELRAFEPALRELRAIYPDPRAFADSTAAARINAYLSDWGTRAQLERELPSLGLSPGTGRALLARFHDRED